jgi:predicted pyridoxine 5'-phosphate oxidase superfamily flavin-nucleotide-binding protein
MSALGSPFHEGECAVQERAGVRERAEYLGQHMIRSVVPDQHRVLFTQLPRIFIGSLDKSGQPWASVLQGAPGFIRSPTPTLLQVGARPLPGDPLADNLALGQPLGGLGIQLETRRRNRVNGKVVALAAQGFSLRVDQSFGNCPKYITVRELEARPPRPPPSGQVLDVRALPPAALGCIERADTCFIASASAATPADGDKRQGVDVSHRGGPAGFIHRASTEDGRLHLRIADYPGNNAFNTLGNLAVHPRAGLLVPDFTNGDLLSLACTCTIEWREKERTLCFEVERALYWHAALPIQRL